MKTEFFLLNHLTVDGLVGEDRDDDQWRTAAQSCPNGTDATMDNGGAAAGKEPVVIHIFDYKQMRMRR